LEAALAEAEKRRLALEEAKVEKAKGNKEAVAKRGEVSWEGLFSRIFAPFFLSFLSKEREN